MNTLTKEQEEWLAEGYAELERQQIQAILDDVPKDKQAKHFRLQGLDPKLDKEDTINDQNRRRSLT